ncbi:MAG TPA: hypothetical protein VFN51_01810 [Candidatus Saccharimonadales bacterium]|nr:hypothetical protein [Candidatus Saccharimonadales bacterium]
MIEFTASLVNLNHPQHYLQWSIFTISIANLIIIATMVIIFGLALVLPFPKGKSEIEDRGEISQEKLTAYPEWYPFQFRLGTVSRVNCCGGTRHLKYHLCQI